MKQCPSCNRSFDDSQTFCLEDGTSLTDESATEPISENSPHFCPQCGESTDIDAKFCKHCAFQLIRTDTGEFDIALDVESSKKSGLPIPLIVAGAMAMLVLIALLGWVTFRNRQGPENTAGDVNPQNTSVILSEKARLIEETILRGETLTGGDLEGVPIAELRILRNVHFAKYGRKYDRPGLGDYFYRQSWYKPLDDYSDNVLTVADKANVNLLLRSEETLKNGNATTGVTGLQEADSSPEKVTHGTEHPTILNRETVLSIVTAHMTRSVEAQLTSNTIRNSQENDLYRRMIQDKVIRCGWKDDLQSFVDCMPGSQAGALVGTTYGKLKVHIGEITPEAVSGITTPSEAFAIADVEMVLKPNGNHDLYTKYFDAFDKIYFKRTKKVSLRLYDDGWRFERIVEW